MAELSTVLARAVHLLGIVLATPWVSPEPAPAPLSKALAAAVVLGGLSAAAVVLARSGERHRRIAAALVGSAVLAALLGALFTRGERAPLGRAALWCAPFVWGAVAALVALAAEHWLVARWGRARLVAMAATLVLGALIVAPRAGMLLSRERLWWEALRRDPRNATARAALIEPMLRARRFDEVAALVASCPDNPPDVACGCREIGIETQIRAMDGAAARDAANVLADRCAARPEFAALHAEALALAGDGRGAIAEALRGLEKAHGGPSEGRLRYALALGLERSKRYDEAAAEVERAIAAGAGADAALLSSALAIVRGDYERATTAVSAALAADPDDPRARYNQALIADHQGKYNEARQGYLAVLKMQPDHADARFNLAQLTWRAGVNDEAKHHASRFIEENPNDPRGAQLKAVMGLGP